MNEKYNEIKELILKNQDKNKAFRIVGFYIEFLINKYELSIEQSKKLINKLTQEGLVEEIEEHTCCECEELTNDTFCMYCGQDVDLDSNTTKLYYKLIM